MAAAGAVLLSAVVLAGFPAPQGTQTPLPVPAALIVGRVVDGSSGRPVPGAIVTLDGGVVLPSAVGRAQPRAMTNASGQFVFRKLLKGSFGLTATKNGYADGAYGRRRPGGTTAPLRLEEGERATDVVIRLWRYGSISGTVTDEAGEPLIGVQLRAFQRRYLAGRRRVVQSGTAATDDRGIYRFGTLIPGDYLVAFVSREASMPASTAEAIRAPVTPNDPKAMELMRERMVVGGGAFGSPVAIQVGDMVRQVDMSAPVPPAAADGGPLFIYPTQFFPGVATAARATVVSLESGQQRDTVDFTLRPVRAARVSGIVMGADGPIENVALRLVPAGDESATDVETAATMTGPAGDFTFLGVPAGQYVIKILRVPRPSTPANPVMTQIQIGSSMMITNTVGSSGPARVPDDPTWFAEVPVAVANGDVGDVVVALQRGARLTGRLEFDGSRERPAPEQIARTAVLAERTDATAPGSPLTSVPPGRADESGAFKTYGLPPGKYFVRIGGQPSGWFLKSVISEGRDVSDTPLDLRAADVANVVITFTDRPTTLTGHARTSEGNPDPDALVVVFPVDNSAWSEFGLNLRRMRSVRPAKDGTYTFTGLPAGEYYVAAVNEEKVAQWQDPQVLEELASGAAQVRLADGDTRTQDVKTAGGGR